VPKNQTESEMSEVEVMPPEAIGTAVDAPQSTALNQTIDPILHLIEQALYNPDFDVSRFKILHEVYMDQQKEKARVQFEADLSAMQGELPIIDERGAIKNKQKEIQSTYAYWSDIKATVQPVMSKYGFNLRHRTEQPDGMIKVIATLAHKSGHTIEAEIELQHDSTGSKNSAQAVGSSISYGQKYTARALIGFSTKYDRDDDGGANAGYVESISDEQQDELRQLCTDAEMEVEKFLGHYGHVSFAEIPTSAFNKVKGALIARITTIKARAMKAERELEEQEQVAE